MGYEEYGIIAPAVARLFRFMKRLPPQCFMGDRVAYQSSLVYQDNPEAATRIRARRIDLYVLSWITCEVCLVMVGALWGARAARIVVVLPVLRLLNILEVTVNLNLFDSLTKRSKTTCRLDPAHHHLGIGELRGVGSVLWSRLFEPAIE